LQSEITSRIHSKISIVVEEADESAFWMEIMIEADIVSRNEIIGLMTECNEILKVTSSARKTITNKK
jgi:four helix bundle protein